MAGTKVTNFVKQVRQEASKVTWINRKEVITSTSVVLVMILIASLFFLAVDAVIFNFTQFVMGF